MNEENKTSARPDTTDLAAERNAFAADRTLMAWIGESGRSNADRIRLSDFANHKTAIDVSLVTQYYIALIEGNTTLANALVKLSRPD